MCQMPIQYRLTQWQAIQLSQTLSLFPSLTRVVGGALNGILSLSAIKMGQLSVSQTVCLRDNQKAP